ncbi:hypothetical protein SGFS_009920 [Streptomyces graminofaciens]|uniref:Uncharacterized protein n=1 Tax=Streptomyces graminofaciens TaxID=68212 RepID=A0ABN5VA05_9ACTN|nr:hypothetical protein SGFS_009920 [Streptomyces graminofaciens]
MARITTCAVTADPSLHRSTRADPAGSSVRWPPRQHCSRVHNQRLPIGRHRQPMAPPGTPDHRKGFLTPAPDTIASLQISGTFLPSGRQLTHPAEQPGSAQGAGNHGQSCGLPSRSMPVVARTTVGTAPRL